MLVLFSLFAQVILCQNIDFFTPFGMAQVEDEPLGILESQYGKSSGGNMLYNQEGEVMRGAVNVYLIFYGRKWRPEKRFKIENFVKNLDKSSYFSIIKNYYDKKGNVTGPLILKPSTWLDYEYGKQITVKDLVKLMLQVYPTIDYNGIYTFLTDSETEVSHSNTRRFCKEFCGFHTIFDNRKIAFVGDCGNCEECAPFADSPNFDRSTDGIINILAHEIVETLSNPDTGRSTWIDSDKLEVI
jgi:hypothetical protein